ncbi:hypothetical protein ACVWXM_003326 [Bradyrhizobium sp. GM7.3]
MRSPGTGPVHRGRADEIGVVGEQRAGEAAHHARDDEADQLVAFRGKADRLHALLVGAQALQDEAKARIDDAPDQEDHAEQAGEAEIIELRAVRQINQPGEVAALVDGEAVIAAITRQPRGDVIGHLRERQRDHDEIDAAGAQRQRADHQRIKRGGRKRDRKLDEARAHAFLRQHADRIAADAEIGGVAKTHHAAKTHDEVEARGRQGQDDDAGEQRQDEDVAGCLRIERQQHETRQQQDRDDLAHSESLHRRLAGNSPSGRTTSTIAISR